MTRWSYGVNVSSQRSSLKHSHVSANGGSAVYVPIAMVNPRTAAPLVVAYYNAQTHSTQSRLDEFPVLPVPELGADPVGIC